MPVCLECGVHYSVLTTHIIRKHKMLTSEYRDKYGQNIRFTDDSVKLKQKENGFSPFSLNDAMKRGLSKEDAQIAINKTISESLGRHTSVRCTEYWERNGYSKEEAIQKISDLQCRNQLFFIEKYGQEEGKQKFVEHRKNVAIANSKEFMLANGRSEEDVRFMRDNFSIESLKIKYDLSQEDAVLLRDERMLNNTSCRTLDYWLRKGFSIEKSEELLSKIQTRNVEFFVNKYGKDKGELKYISWVNLATVQTINKSSSKEANLYFAPLIKFCDSINLKYTFEKFVSFGTKCYYIDLTIESLRLSFEYDGEKFHPDPENYDPLWKPLKGNSTEKERRDYDSRKNSDIESLGYHAIRIYSKRKHEINLIEIVKAKIDEYKRIS